MTPRKKKSQHAPLEGSWSVITLEVDGQPVAAEMLAAARIVVTGDRFESLGMGAIYEGSLKLDATQEPHTVDMIFTAGPEQGNTALGIYSLHGDNWKLCLTTRGGERPTRFASEPGTGHALETLRRSKKGSVSSSSHTAVAIADMPAGTGPDTELEGEWSMASGSMNGQALDAGMVRNGKRVTRGNRTKVFFGSQVFLDATFTLNQKTSPREIDYVTSQGKTQLGIYECTGEDLNICSSAPGQPRPKDFESKKGDRKTVSGWKRVNEGEKPR